MLDERAFLTFKKKTWLQALHSVPCVLGDIYPMIAIFPTNDAGLYHFAVIIVDGHPDLAFQDDEGLILGRMMMHRNLCAWLQSIEETMALVGKALVKIVVHPQPRRLPCLVRHFLYQLFIYDFHFCDELKVISFCTMCWQSPNQ